MSFNNSRLKRAGLDYWRHISLFIYESVEEFYAMHSDKKLVYFSSHGTQDHWSIAYEDEMFLVFGKESSGLSKEIIEKNKDQLYKIPLYNEHIRSLNLANAVGIAIYEGFFLSSRQPFLCFFSLLL